MKDCIWVFGYGSLMWQNDMYNPHKIVDAELFGMHRSFNLISTISRGTKEKPGVVLGLEKGGSCKGRAILVNKKFIPEIDKRESVKEGVYKKVITPTKDLRVVSKDGILTDCIVYISNPDSKSYIGHLSLKQRAKMSATACPGKSGTSFEYCQNTHEDLKKLEIYDKHVIEMCKEVKEIQKSLYS